MNKLVGWLLLFVGLLALTFNTSWGAILCFVALIPLFVFIDKARALKWSNRRIIKYVWVAGLIFNAIVLFWFNQLQLESATNQLHKQIEIILIFIWIVISIEASIGIFITIFFVTKLKIDLFRYSSLLYIPALWTVGEYFRSYISTILWWNPQATIGPLWNNGALGLAVGSTPLGHLAAFGGLYGLSFIIVMVNLVLFWIIKRRNTHIAALVLGIIILLNFAMYAAYSKPSGSKINVGLVQLKQFDKLDTPQFQSAIKSGKSLSNYDLILLPEYSQYFKNPNGNVQKDIFDKLFVGKPGLMISAGGPDAIVDNNKPRKTSTIVYRNENLETVSVQEKNFLLAFGEYLPSGPEFLVKVLGKQSVIDDYKQYRVLLEKGKTEERPVQYNDVSYGTLSCSGVATPYLYKKLVNQGAEVLASSSSLGIIDGSDFAMTQAEQMVRFTAIATSRPYLQSSRGGYSYIIDHNGKILIKNWGGDLELVSGHVNANTKKTPYVIFGDIGIPISFGIVFALFVLKYKAAYVDKPVVQHVRKSPARAKKLKPKKASKKISISSTED